MIITLLNPSTDDLEKTYLSNAISSGVTSLPVKNNDRFVANDRVMIGEQGQENTEVVTYSASPDNMSITVGTTQFPHSANDSVYRLRFDQVKFYRSTTGINGTYTVISTQNLDVDNFNQTTVYDDTGGLATYYYKMSVYHSLLALESSLSDPIPGGGFSRSQVGRIIDEILTEVSDPGEQHITRREILGYFNDVNDDLQINVVKPYDFLRTRITMSSVAGHNYLDFPTDSSGNQTMWKFDRMDYQFTDLSGFIMTYTLKVLPEEEFRNTYQETTITTADEDDQTQTISLDTALNRFRYWPPHTSSIANAFYLYYWKYFDEITSEGNIVETPTPKIYKLYAKMMYYTKRAISDVTLASTANNFSQKYEIEKVKYKGTDRKDAGTPRSFRPSNSITKGYRR